MMSTFHLEIITPERIAYQDEVEMVVAPGVEGVMGILAHHSPIFTQLCAGELKITKGTEDYFLSIGGGFLEVTPEKTIVLVTKALHADEINEKEVENAKKAAEEALKSKPVGDDLQAVQASLRATLVDLKVLQRHRIRRTIH